MLFLPILIWVLHEHRVVVLNISGHLFAEPLWLYKSLVLCCELNFSHNKAFVVTVEFVYLICVLTSLNKITSLVDYAWLADLKKVLNFCYRNFLLPLETACTTC